MIKLINVLIISILLFHEVTSQINLIKEPISFKYQSLTMPQESVVTLQNWSDFVFSKDYQLPELGEVEKNILENGHLPGIPTEKEVKKNGLNLGEMNAKLLQKIEELTLYVIQLKKEIVELKNQKESER